MENRDYQERVLDSLERLNRDITQVRVDIATIKSSYVTRSELEEANQKQITTRRWLIGTGATYGALLITILGILIN